MTSPVLMQRGDLLGVPASGRQIRWNAVDIYRIADDRISDGRISEDWAADVRLTCWLSMSSAAVAE